MSFAAFFFLCLLDDDLDLEDAEDCSYSSESLYFFCFFLLSLFSAVSRADAFDLYVSPSLISFPSIDRLMLSFTSFSMAEKWL